MNIEISDERRIDFYTRTGESRPFVMPDPETEDGGKNSKHDFPAKDQARNNLLLEGADDVETARLNARAAIMLTDIRSWIKATHHSAYCGGHNESGADSEDNEFDFGTGHGVDIRHDNGPSVFRYNKKTKTYRSRLKELYEAGSPTKAALGQPWHAGPVQLATTETDDGMPIKYLDLPLNLHPIAIRVSADVTPFGAG